MATLFLRRILKVTALPPNPLRITRVANSTIPVVVDRNTRDDCCPSLLVAVVVSEEVDEAVVVSEKVDEDEDDVAPGASSSEETEQSMSRRAIGSTIVLRCTISQSSQSSWHPSTSGVRILPLNKSRKANLLV